MKPAPTVFLASLVLLAAVIVLRLAQPTLFRSPELPVIETLGGDFGLPGTPDGAEIQLSDFRGRLVLLDFGFASCPDVCPTALSRIRQVLLDLGGDAGQVQPLFVTIDPERDTLESLGPYVRHFHPAFIALRGTPERTREFATLFRVYYEREPMPPPMDYGFAHSDQIYLLDREGRVRATFANTMTIAQMTATVRQLLAQR